MRKPCPKIFFFALACLLLAGRVFAQSPVVKNTEQASTEVTQRAEKSGVAIDFSLSSLRPNSALTAGSDAVVTIKITDARTGQPLANLRPKAWLSARKTEAPPNEEECKARIRSYLSGKFIAAADIDLNTYRLLTLNSDKTIAFINPQLAFSKTKLESIVILPGIGMDWALAPEKKYLYVTMPDQSAVAIVNTITKKLIATLPTGEKTKPARIQFQPDGRYVWVGLDNGSQVLAIDATTNKIAARITVQGGLHNFAFTADSRLVGVTNSAENSVSIIDTQTLKNIADVPTGKTPVAIAYSAASQLFYVAAINGGSLSAIDATSQKNVATITARPGLVALRFDPEGRFAVVVNQMDSTISVLDAATNVIIATGQVIKEPDQVAFTQRYAYVHSIGTEKFSLLDLSELRKGKIAPTDIQAGRLAPSTEPNLLNVAAMVAPTPDGNAVMIANAPDAMVYYYSEGLMAPMGTFSNYKRAPLAVMILDNSLSETPAGVYSTTVKLTSGGKFEVPILLDQPRVTTCFQVSVAGDPLLTAAPSILAEALFKGANLAAHVPAKLQFKITDATTKQPVTGLRDVRVMVLEPPGIWQQRNYATEIAPGIYELAQVFPHGGNFMVLVSVDSRGLGFDKMPRTAVQVITQGAQR